MPKETPENLRRNKYNNYIREITNLRALPLPEDDTESGKMIIEGRAVVFDEVTVLFKIGDIEYKEVIKRGAFDGADISYCFLKYNHSDHVMAMARTKNNTLKIIIRDDGVYIQAELANTTSGRDLYELIKRGDIDKMSFAFTIREESYDKETHTWTVYKIDKVYDVSAVNVPAYESTSLYSRRFDDAEARQREAVEAAEREAKIELERRKALLHLQLIN